MYIKTVLIQVTNVTNVLHIKRELKDPKTLTSLPEAMLSIHLPPNAPLTQSPYGHKVNKAKTATLAQAHSWPPNTRA